MSQASGHRTSSSDRVQRILAIVPWIAAHDGPTLDEVCQRFGITRSQLLSDLDVLPFVGVPPYTPDTLIEVVVEGDRIWMRFADVFAQPLRLTPDQAVALVAAGQAARGMAGSDPDGPLPRALAKLADTLGITPEAALSVELGRVDEGVLASVRRAVHDRRRVRIEYHAHSNDRLTTREVDPHAVFAHQGAWYLVGHCYLAAGGRQFRIDRVRHIDVLDEPVTTEPPQEATLPTFLPDAETPRVTLELKPEARWVAEYHPVEEVADTPDGGLRVRMAVAGRSWFEGLMLQLGPAARVVEATEPQLARAGRDAARRVLARYR